MDGFFSKLLAAGFCEAVELRRGNRLSPERRRRAVAVLQERYQASERLACRGVGQHRSTQRHTSKAVDIEEAKLRHRFRETGALLRSAPSGATHIRWGRRMASRLLRREEDLQRPTPRKRKRARFADGCTLKFLDVIDEISRPCLAIRVGRRCKSKDVVAVLEELTSLNPAPALIRSDNGPEFIAQALRNWCEVSTTTSTARIVPGSPCENGFAGSFNDRFRDEFLNTEPFTTTPEAQILADRWRREYNSLKPHSALQGRTHLEAAQQGVAA